VSLIEYEFGAVRVSVVKAIRIDAVGGPDVMRLQEVPLDPPEPGMVTVRNKAIGLNYIDCYHRSGLYPLPLPAGLGLEGAGDVEAVGAGTDLQIGDRVAYCSAGFGAYSEALNLPASRLVKVPDGIDYEQAAACLLKGQTAEYLIQRTYALQSGETCLFHAAAGGVGLLFGQWAASIGATAIGTVSSAEKAELALARGYAHVINYSEEDAFDLSLSCLRPRGLMVSFGNASGSPDPLDLQRLAAHGSLYVTRPTMLSYTATEEELRQSSEDVFTKILAGDISVEINQRYPLAQVQQAHKDLQSRLTTGSTVLLP
jgi:NADPH2:quinone reductase